MMKIEYRPVENESPPDAGRMLLGDLYRQHTGEDLPPIARGDRGKPYFLGSSFHFSITHTKHHAFCALSDKPVGIDAEELDRNIDLRLAGKILSPFEIAQFEAAADKRISLLTFWVLKEAAGKCTGAGINGYPNHTNFSLDEPRVTTHHGCLQAVIQEDDHAF